MRGSVVLLVAVVMAAAIFADSSQRVEAHTVSGVQLVVQASGKCMQPVGMSQGNGAKMEQRACSGSTAQKWSIIPTADPAVHIIKNDYSQKCLDIDAFNPYDGLRMQQWACNGDVAQNFVAPTCAGCWGVIVTVLQPQTPRCVDLKWADQADGAWIWLWPCNNELAQNWQEGLVYSRGNTPFSGKWGSGDGFFDARPWGHHIVECEPSGYQTYEFAQNAPNCKTHPNSEIGGDWSLDYFAVPNTEVRLSAAGVGVAPTMYARVRAIAPTCNGDSFGGDAGNTVFVDLYGPTMSQWRGWISFGHLKDISVAPTQWISAGQLLGKTELWNYWNGCWQVSTQSGVHTHIEMHNRQRYACFVDWQAMGWNLTYGAVLGYVGRADSGAYRTPCP